MARTVPTREGCVAYVDDDMYDIVMRFQWLVSPQGYARTGTSMVMHRLVLGDIEGMEIDHINGNKLDNRRCNLRHLTRSQNNLNRRNVTGVKERVLASGESRFDARLQWQGSQIHFGTFKTYAAARRAVEFNRQRLLTGRDPITFGRGRWRAA